MVAEALPKNAGKAIEQMGELRKELRKVAPAQDEGKRRMEWIKKCSDAYGWEDMGEMTGEDMKNLLEFYRKDEGPGGYVVPTMEELKALRKENHGKDGVDEVQERVDGLTIEDKA